MKLSENYPLLKYNTFGINAHARYFSTFTTLKELQELLSQKVKNDLTILGGGSNILLTKDFNGLVLKNEVNGINKVKEDEQYYYIKVGAGENWHRFVLYCIEHNYAGLENLSLIPGNVGASPMQNIGAYGVEIKDVFDELQAYHLQENELITFTKEECKFGYRESIFKKKHKGQFAIMNVTYRLRKKPEYNINYGSLSQELEAMDVEELSIKAISQAVINIRSSKLPDPSKIGNAGSFFKNPEVEEAAYLRIKAIHSEVVAFPIGKNRYKLAAGWLIEQCGWKGYREGDAGVHPKQALVLVNYGNASGEEIFDLSQKILDSVFDKFNVRLKREVNVI